MPSAEGNPKTNKNTICWLCGKSFPSMKSLFGHMRCHPEIDWKGIPPPQNNSSSHSIYCKKMNDQSQSESLHSWSMTAKRGRKNITTIDSEQIPKAAYDLMMLAHGNREILPNKAKIEDRYHVTEYLDSKKERSSKAGNRNLVSKKLKIDERGSRRNEEIGAGNMHLLSEKMIGGKGNGVSETGVDLKPVIMEDESEDKTPPKNRKKKIKLRYLERVGGLGLMDYKERSDRYKCITCNKSFPSHQALGGHRSSYKKCKNSIPIADMVESASSEPYGFSVTPTQVHDADAGAGSRLVTTHRCKICSKTFWTGQALGGHKRCHWTGPVEASSSSVASPEEGSKTGFDLNELPVIEDEEEGLESAFAPSGESVYFAS